MVTGGYPTAEASPDAYPVSMVELGESIPCAAAEEGNARFEVVDILATAAAPKVNGDCAPKVNGPLGQAADGATTVAALPNENAGVTKVLMASDCFAGAAMLVPNWKAGVAARGAPKVNAGEVKDAGTRDVEGFDGIEPKVKGAEVVVGVTGTTGTDGNGATVTGIIFWTSAAVVVSEESRRGGPWIPLNEFETDMEAVTLTGAPKENGKEPFLSSISGMLSTPNCVAPAPAPEDDGADTFEDELLMLANGLGVEDLLKPKPVDGGATTVLEKPAKAIDG